MSRPTRSSRILAKTIQRVAGMRTIADPLDFGDDLSLAAYDAKNQALQMLLSAYNTKLEDLDRLSIAINAAEKDLGIYAEKMLMCVATRYGKQSLQYEKAGGVRRKSRSVTKLTPSPAPVPVAVFLEAPQSPSTNGKVAPVGLT
jgi:hypothetical protein